MTSASIVIFFSVAFLTDRKDMTWRTATVRICRRAILFDLWKASRQKMGTYFLLGESMSPHHTLLNCRGVPARPLTTAVRREVRASNRSGRSSVRSGTWMVKTSRVGLIRREARVLLSFGLLVAAWRDAKANLQRL